MKTKPCGDQQCRRSWQQIPLTDFPVNRKSKDGRYYICKECARRKSDEYRRARGAKKYDKLPAVERKANFVAQAPNALTVVYEYIAKGPTTRNKIRVATGLDWDSITESLAELVFVCRVVKNENGTFVFVGSEAVAA